MLILWLLTVIWALVIIVAGLGLIFVILSSILALMLLILIRLSRLIVFLTAFNTIWGVNLVDFNILVGHALSARLCINFEVVGVLCCLGL